MDFSDKHSLYIFMQSAFSSAFALAWKPEDGHFTACQSYFNNPLQGTDAWIHTPSHPLSPIQGRIRTLLLKEKDLFYQVNDISELSSCFLFHRNPYLTSVISCSGIHVRRIAF